MLNTDSLYGRVIIYHVILCLCLFAPSMCATDSEEYNLINAERPFRINKLNMVWEKAKKKLKKDLQEDLFRELRVQDKLELELKSRKGASKDFDTTGEQEAIIREKFIRTLKKFGLADSRFDNMLPDDNETIGSKYKNMDPMKLDKRLYQIWKKALSAGFSDEQLEELKEELLHHSQKLEELDMLHNELSQMPADNSLQQHKDAQSYDTMKAKKKDLTERYRALKEELLNIEHLGNRKPSTDVKFNDPRVVELWAAAKKANLTDDELISVKQELFHFERRIEKHNYLKSDLERRQIMYKTSDKLPHDLNKLQQQVAEYDRQMKKMYYDLEQKLLQKGEL